MNLTARGGVDEAAAGRGRRRMPRRGRRAAAGSARRRRVDEGHGRRALSRRAARPRVVAACGVECGVEKGGDGEERRRSGGGDGKFGQSLPCICSPPRASMCSGEEKGQRL